MIRTALLTHEYARAMRQYIIKHLILYNIPQFFAIVLHSKKNKICVKFSLSSLFCAKIGKTICMKKAFSKILFALAALMVGFINGFFGGGGGMLCVPLLEYGAKLPTKKAHATAIPIILPITIASAIIYIVKGCFEWGVTISVGVGVIGGGIVGAVLLKKLPPFIVGVAFSLLMIAAGVRMMFP